MNGKLTITWDRLMPMLTVFRQEPSKAVLWMVVGLWIETHGTRGELIVTPADRDVIAEQSGCPPLLLREQLSTLPRVKVLTLGDSFSVKMTGMKTMGKPKKQKPKEEWPEGQGPMQLIETYAKAYEVEFKAKPQINYAIDVNAAKELLKQHGWTEAVKYVEEFLRRPPKFYREKAMYDLRHIPGAVNRINARRAEETM